MGKKAFNFPAPYREPLTEEQFRQDRFLRYIPFSFKVHKTFYSGYNSVVIIIGNILGSKSPDNIPDIASIGRYTVRLGHYNTRDLDFFTQKGGRFRHALDCIISIASDEEGSRRDDSVVPSSESQGVADLPHCANDLAFDLVRKKFGL
jgi:hypothetical protein